MLALPAVADDLPALVLSKNTTKQVGRVPELKITSTKVSRLHCKLTWQGASVVSIEAVKPVFVVKQDGQVIDLTAAAHGELHPGDTLYLERGRDGRDTGFIYPETSSDDGGSKNPLKRPASASPRAGRVHPPAPPGASTSAAIFSKCKVVFWYHQHTSVLKQRFCAHGGQLQNAVTASTTHVICTETPLELALSKLRDCKVCETADDTVECLSDFIRHIFFVTPAWVSDSISSGTRLSEKLFSAPVYRALRDHLASEDDKQAGPPPAQKPDANAATANAATTSSQKELERVERFAQTQAVNAAAPDASKLRAAYPNSVVSHFVEDVECVDAWKPEGWTSAKWGENGCWLEPYDTDSSMATLTALFRHWHRLEPTDAQERVHFPFTMAAASQAPGRNNGALGDDSSLRGSDSEQDEPATALSNCTHPCCQASHTCFIRELQELKTHYTRPRTGDQFRVRATDRAMATLMALTHPLRNAADVNSLQPSLGSKSRDKVIEILETGKLSRNVIMRDDERNAVLELFITIWGVGPATASRWFNAGLRTLDDLRRRSDLTSQQRTGLRHFDDLQQRIPRVEVAAAVEIVCRAIVEELMKISGKPQAAVEDHLHARATGSYIRGKPATGDIDMLVIPPDSLGDICCRRLLAGVIATLRASEFVTDDMPLLKHDATCLCHGLNSCTWMGICYVPGLSSPQSLA